MKKTREKILLSFPSGEVLEYNPHSRSKGKALPGYAAAGTSAVNVLLPFRPSFRSPHGEHLLSSSRGNSVSEGIVWDSSHTGDVSFPSQHRLRSVLYILLYLMRTLAVDRYHFTCVKVSNMCIFK